MTSVHDAPDRNRFEIEVDGKLAGFVVYKRTRGMIAFLHTEIEPEHEHEGLASMLAKTALDTARSEGAAVLPFCPFVRSYIERHREYADLVPVERRAEFGLDG